MTDASGKRLRMRYSWESRLRAVQLALRGGLSVAAVARSQGVGEAALRRRLRRYRAEGAEGLRDRSSRPQRSPRRTPPAVEARILAVREQTRSGPLAVGAAVGVAPSTVGKVLRRRGCSRLPRAPRPPVRRYERERPGDLLHVDSKRLPRFRRPGRRVDGGGRTRSPGAGYEFAHAAVDDHTRLAYVELPPRRNGRAAAAFLGRAALWFARLGVALREAPTDNGGGYRARRWVRRCAVLGLRRLYTRPYRPQTNGKAERFIQTLTNSWAHIWSCPNSAARNRALPSRLRWYNRRRPHTALGNLPPLSRLSDLCSHDT